MNKNKTLATSHLLIPPHFIHEYKTKDYVINQTLTGYTSQAENRTKQTG